MRKILIALDSNPTAKKVAEAGYKLGKNLDAEITIMHVVADPAFYSTAYSTQSGYWGYLYYDPLQSDILGTLKKSAQDYLNNTIKHLNDTSIKTVVEEGNCADAILRIAHERQIDIIVMGSHSNKWLEDVLLGSNTEKVLHHSTVPLYIVPTKKSDN